MHNDIAILVRAPDRKSAKEDALKLFEKVKARSSSYDGFSPDDVLPYDTEEGKSLLQTIFGRQTLEFNDYLAEVRVALTESPKSDDELMEDHQFRFACWSVGNHDGWTVRVFDNEACGVSDQGHLKNVIEDWPSLVEAGQHKKSPYPLWVVAGDAHH